MAESNLIKFKRGTQASLNTLMANKGGEDGCFYLTVDTNSTTNKPISSKLYVGRSSGEIVPVNQGIITVSTTTELNTLTANHTFSVGDFAYIETGNILAVYSDNGKWIQINERPLDEFLKGLSTEATATSNTATVSITADMNVGTDHDTEFKITGTGGIDVTASGSTVTIEGNEYSIATAAKSGGGYNVELSSTNSNTKSAVGFKAGSSNLTITESNGTLTFNSVDTKNQEVTITKETGANKGFTVNVKDSNNITKSGSVDPIITVGDTNKSSAHFDNGTATLSVYSIADIDEKFKGIDSMTYKGMIGGTGGTAGANITAVVDAKPHIGDTYKIGAAMNLPASYSPTGSAIAMKVGDIIIATGTEDASTGEITSGTLKFDYIPAADDIEDTTYEVSTTTHGINIKNNSNVSVGGIALTAGNAITLTDTVSGKNNSIAVGHSNVTRTDATGTATSNAANGSVVIPAVTSVTTNAQGHVTAVETTNFTVDSKAKNLTGVTVGTSGSNNNITVTNTYSVVDPFSNIPVTGITSAFALKSDNLQITADGSTITVNNVWGTF